MSPPQRQSSWSFSLKDDEYSDSSQEKEELPQPPPVARRTEADQLIAEAEEEAVAQDPEPELFDISLVEEGDVRFVETPFTIARRVAATRKRAHKKEEEEAQEKLLPAAPLRKTKKPKFEVPKKKASSRRKGMQTERIPDDELSAASTWKLSPPTLLSATARPQNASISLSVSSSNFTVAPQIRITAPSKLAAPTLTSAPSPKTSSSVRFPSSTETSHLDQTEPVETTTCPSAHGVPAAGESYADLEGAEATSSVLGSEGSSWGVGPTTTASIAETLPSSPPTRSPSPSRPFGSSSTRSSTTRPRYQLQSVSAPDPVSKLNAVAPRSAGIKSTVAPPSEFNETPSFDSVDSQSASSVPAPSFKLQTPPRYLKPAFAPLIPRPPPHLHTQSSASANPSTPQKSQPHKLPDLSPPPTFSPRYSRPIASSPSHTRPAPTPPRPSASSSNAHWSTLSSRSRPSLVPTPSSYGSALNGISSTSAVATRFALPEFAPQGGGVGIRPGAGGGKKTGFKPTESLSAFKARIEREKMVEQPRGRAAARQVIAEDAQERILLGANLRSVKPGTVVSVERSGSKEQGGQSSVYRDFAW